MKGLFIVLEGIDGCGKTTQIKELKSWLPTSGLIPEGKSLLITREPGGTLLGSELRQILLNDDTADTPAPIAELLLYAADRAQHVSNLIIPALNNGDWVISDRFSGSTIAYQGYGRDLNLNTIKDLERIATQSLNPDLTLLLDINVKESIARRKKKSNDRIEKEGEIFLSKVARGFLELAKERSWVRIAGEHSAELISKQIKSELKEYLLQIGGEKNEL